MSSRSLHRGAVAAFSACLLSCIAIGAADCDDLDGDGFLAGPGCVVQEDCNDRNAKVFPGAAEACNGWDDDCDGELDEVCDRTCDDFEPVRRVFIEDVASEPRIDVAERGWALAWSSGIDGFPDVATRIDERGEKLSPVSEFTLRTNPHSPEIVWTGSEIHATFEDNNGSESQESLWFRDLGPWGKPKSEMVLINGAESASDDLAWNGYETGILWTDYTARAIEDGHLFSRVAPDATLRQEAVYLTEIDPSARGSFAWDGDGYGWVYGINVHDFGFQRFAPDGQLIGPLVPFTNLVQGGPVYAREPNIVDLGPGGGYAVAYRKFDESLLRDDAFLILLDADGNVVDPPGEIPLPTGDREPGRLHDIVWNGHELMLVWDLDSLTCPTSTGTLMATRVSATGEVLQESAITEGRCHGEPRIAWNGRSYGVFFEQVEGYPTDEQPAVEFVEIGCNCSTDGDGDGVLPCASGDCDDTDPSVATGFLEVCTDGKDNDCDGLVDCNDPDCAESGKAPAAIGGVVFAGDKQTLSWTEDGKASGYDIARGVLSDLRDMENFRWADCAASRTTGTSWMDAELPEAGQGFYYAIRGTARTCLVGTWGSSLRDGSLRGCP